MPDTKNIKVRLLSKCQENIQNKIDLFENQLRSIQDSRNNETKSSAGDKFETGRAMMQIEEDKVGRQLQQAFEHLQILNNLPTKTSTIIGPGSIVITDQRNYLIGISIGKVQVNEETYYCISKESPIGHALWGKKSGDQLAFNNKAETILNVF